MRYALTSLLWLPLMVLAAPAQKITLVADEWCPYNCTPGSALPGYAIEIATEIFKQHNISIDYQLLPWTRAIAMTRSGHYQGIIGAIPVEAEGFHFGEEPIGKVRHTLYASPDTDWQYQDPGSLQDIRLGVIQDYSYGSELTEYIAGDHNDGDVTVLGGDSALLRLTWMLESGRIDALVEDQSVFQFFRQSSGITTELRTAGVAASDAIYIAFSPADPGSAQYRQWLDQGIREMRKNGRLDEILQRYQLADWN